MLLRRPKRRRLLNPTRFKLTKMEKVKSAASDMNDRKCIVTGQSGDAEGLIRFVAGPDDNIFVDLKRKLPGRGCWVTAKRSYVEQAVAKNAFSRALKRKVIVDPAIADLVDQLMAKSAIGTLGLARKAGVAVTGAAQVEKAVRSGKALAVLHSKSGAPDGVRKIDQARRATVHLGGPHIESFSLFGPEELDLAFGGGNVIHAAITDAGPGKVALQKLKALKTFREIADEQDMPMADADWDVQETDEE